MPEQVHEDRHEEVYGATFALYGEKEIKEFIEPLVIRFQRNGIDPQAVFSGKTCFDAGCGGGRGAIFMLMNGAKSVTAFDYSHTNVETAIANARNFGFDNITGQPGTLADLPFDDGAFDFVWCNGVIHHTAEPDTCLREVTRVLTTNGQAWFYLYGVGGAYWYSIRRFRAILAPIDTKACMGALQLMRYQTRFVAEFIDDWKVPFLRTYANADVATRLKELGFADPKPLPYGVDYDTNHIVNTYPEEERWLGGGELRYLVTKTAPQQAGGHPLSASEYGSDVPFADGLVAVLKPPFDALEKSVAGNPVLAVAACAFIQKRLRELLSDKGPFPMDEYVAVLEHVTGLTRFWA